MLETLNINFKNDNRHLVVGSFRHNANAWTTLRASTYKGTQRMFSVKINVFLKEQILSRIFYSLRAAKKF